MGIGTTDLFSPVSKPKSSQFDLWNAGGSDFPSPSKVPKIRQESPTKSMYAPPPSPFSSLSLLVLSIVDVVNRSKSISTPAFPRPVSRGPTFVNNSPVKAVGRKRHSGGDEGDKIPGIRRF